MSAPAPTPARRDTNARGVAAVRAAFPVATGALAWLAVIGLGVVGFSPQVTTRPLRLLREDLLGFAAAFAVAGTMSGFVAAATSGRRRWALGFGSISLATLGAAAATLRWWILGLRGSAWGARTWISAAGAMRWGLAMGTVAGLAISGLVLAAAVVERSVERWKFGLIVAVAVAMLGQVVLPMAMSQVSDLIVLYAGPHYRYLHERAVTGSSIGACTGALVGAVVVGMIARFFATPEQRAGRPPGDAAPRRKGGPQDAGHDAGPGLGPDGPGASGSRARPT